MHSHRSLPLAGSPQKGIEPVAPIFGPTLETIA
jgi:hypothetical protein